MAAFAMIPTGEFYSNGDAKYELWIDGKMEDQPYYYDKENGDYHPDEINEDLLDRIIDVPTDHLPEDVTLWVECIKSLGVFNLYSLMMLRRGDNLTIKIDMDHYKAREMKIKWNKERFWEVLRNTALENGLSDLGDSPYSYEEPDYFGLLVAYQTIVKGTFGDIVNEVVALCKNILVQAEAKMISLS